VSCSTSDLGWRAGLTKTSSKGSGISRSEARVRACQSNDQRLPTTVGTEYGPGAHVRAGGRAWLCFAWRQSLSISMTHRDRCSNSNGDLVLKVFFLPYSYSVS
jgi:hypothetical protein